MTEKRFTVTDWGIGMQITDHHKNKEYSNLDDICEELNALHEENKRLKAHILRYTDYDYEDIQEICKDENLSVWWNDVE